jgi:hypothetical protein
MNAPYELRTALRRVESLARPDRKESAGALESSTTAASNSNLPPRWVSPWDAGFRMIVYALTPEHCHRLVWPGELANPSQIVQGPPERAANFILHRSMRIGAHA